MNKKIVLSFTTSLLLMQSTYAKDVKHLDTITVTAQKAEENVQDVPISISVFDEFSLEDRNIDNVTDIAKYTPGLQIISGNALKSAPSIRGLYADYVTRSSTAGLYVDGIPITGGTGFDETLIDIERVEVLKGPQGTLYGKNTEVGVINIFTKKPNNELRGKVKGTLGSDNKKEFILTTSGPIIKDQLYVGISGKHYEKDGYVNNTTIGKKTDNREHNYGKINLRWTPTDNLEASLITSKIKYDNGGNSLGLCNTNDREVSSDFKEYNINEVLMNALNISYTINNNLSLHSITAYRDYKEKNANDFDYTNNYSRRFHSSANNRYKTLSEELRINYESENIQFISGIFLEKSDINYDKNDDKWWLPSITNTTQDIDGDTKGIFSHLTYGVNEKLSLIGGLRFDNEQKTYKDSSETIEYDEDEISPKIGLTYDLKENMMTYATISKGYRAGGFNTYAPAGYSKTYDKENLYSYEVGLKGSSLDGKLTYDTALYYMKISDMQVDIYVGQQLLKTNAAKATSQGIETSLNYQATDNINLFGGFSYNDIQYDQYNDGKKDHSGNRTTYAPKYNYSLGISYRANNGYYANADISGYGDMYIDSANEYKRDAYEIVNTKIGYEQESYDIYLYAKNLFDKNYDTNGVYSGIYKIYSPPREVGIQLAYRF